MLRLILFTLAVVGQFIAIQAQADEKPRDVSGEWAVEWVDKRGRDYRETFFVQLRHEEKTIDGTGLDPELIPSVIKGTVEGDRVEFVCEPDRHPLPFKVPPTGTFQGRVTADDAMEGTWVVEQRDYIFSRRPKGDWTAKRTRTDGRSTVAITRKTKITLA